LKRFHFIADTYSNPLKRFALWFSLFCRLHNFALPAS
jgi:hypothetical protein